MMVTQRLIRAVLLVAALLLCTALIAGHGLRGIAVVAGAVVLASAVRTRGFRAAERTLVRITGSRQRALLLIMSVMIAAMVAASVIQIVR